MVKSSLQKSSNEAKHPDQSGMNQKATLKNM